MVPNYFVVGYGTPAPRTQTGRIFCIVYGLLGVPLMLVTVADIAKFLGFFFNKFYMSCLDLMASQRRGSLFSKKVLEKRKASTLLSSMGENYVPIHLLLLVFLVYPAFSGYVISLYEAWDWMSGICFGFVSTLTIGFGDNMPKNTSLLLLTLLFLFFGVRLNCFSAILYLTDSRIIQISHFTSRVVIYESFDNKPIFCLSSKRVMVCFSGR